MKTIKLVVDHNPSLSKNARYVGFRSKHKNPAHLAAQNEIAWLFKKALLEGHHAIKKQKLWIGIYWYRKNMVGDIQNFINPICDAIKQCLTFDDNWMAISIADWEIDTSNHPRLEIEVMYDENI